MTTIYPTSADRQHSADLIYGFMFSQVCAAAVRLGIPELLEHQARGLDDLAAATASDSGQLYRLLRALCALDVLEQPDRASFRLTNVGSQFLAGRANWVPAFTRYYSNPSRWRAWSALAEAVQTGIPAFDHVTGEDFFTAIGHDPNLANEFHGAMASDTDVLLPAIVKGYDFGSFEDLVDVGGGDGTLLSAVLEHYSHLGGTVFDSACEALSGAHDVLQAHGVAGRCSVKHGDFFSTVPNGRDGYLLKNILHDWSDQQCVPILQRCREAMTDDGRVLVLTHLMPDWNESVDVAAWLEAVVMDIEMLAMTSGKERTLEQYGDLFEAAGLTLMRCVRIPDVANFYVIEAGRA